MGFNRLSLEGALDLVKSKRQGVRPNYGFLEQLVAWEEDIFGKRLTDVSLL